jgi:hypothetical protein
LTSSYYESTRRKRGAAIFLVRSIAVFALTLVWLVISGGCTHLNFYRISHDANGNEQFNKNGGICYYAPEPYVEIDVGAQGYCQTTVKWLPDYNREYEIQPHYWLGTVSLKPTLSDGWNLTALDSSVDTKVPEMVTAMTGVLSAATKAAGLPEAPSMAATAGETIIKSPGLYRLVLPGAKEQDGTVAAQAKLEPVFVIGDESRKALVCPKGKPPAPQKQLGAGHQE